MLLFLYYFQIWTHTYTVLYMQEKCIGSTILHVSLWVV